MLRIAVLLALAGSVAAAPASAAPRISVSPTTVDRDQTQTVKGRGWPVTALCEPRVVVKLKSDQNRVRLGSARVRRSGRFRFEWNAEDANVGSGSWRLVARMRCDKGVGGSPSLVRRRVDIRIR